MKIRMSFLVVVVFWMFSCKNTPEIFIDIRNVRNSDSEIRSFLIHNKGEGDLIIEDFTSSCECTALNLSKGLQISPHDSLKVQVKIIKEQQDADNTVYVTIKTNASPRLSSFHFKP